MTAIKARPRKRKSLAFHLGSRTIFALAVLGTLLYWSLVKIIESTMADGYMDLFKVSAFEYVTIAAPLLNDPSEEKIQKFLKDFGLRSYVVYAELELNERSYIDDSSDLTLGGSFLEDYYIDGNGDNIYYFSLGFYLDADEPAKFKVGFDETEISNRIRRAQLSISAVIISLFCIFLSFVFVYSRIITVPLSRLADKSDDVSGGKTEQTLEIASGILEFNSMASSLEGMRQQLVHRNTELRQQVVQDPLTGIPNRLLFNEGLATALHRTIKFKETYALVMVDIDDFKSVNDTYGHPVGDRLIKFVSYWLQRVDRANLVARIGGDEFAILIADTDRTELSAFCTAVVRCLVRDVKIREQILPVSISLGAALLDAKKKLSTDDFIQQADFALYAAKSSPDHFAIFDEALFAHTTRAKNIARALKAADFRNLGLRMMYQPKFNINSNQPTSIEALVRWDHPEMGSISPVEFIAIAEQQQLMTRLTTYIIDMVMIDTRKWRGKGLDIQTAINISPQDINNESFLDILFSALEVYSVPATSIQLEITETALVENSKSFADKLKEVRNMGIGIAIDDFGSGYANFINLKSFPFETIKIDQSFVRDMQHRKQDRILVKGAIDIAHNLGMKVIAEGVETEAVRDILQNLGCEEAQGMWFCSPMEATEVTELFQKHQPLEQKI